MTDRRQRGRTGPVLLPLLVAWGFGMVVVGGVAVQRDDVRTLLFTDPNASAALPWYTGLVSELGILGWAAAATAAAAASFVAVVGRRRGAAWFLVHGSALGTLLCLDDLLQLHSGPLLGLLGVPKPGMLALLIAAVVHWVMAHRHEFARTRRPLLVGAGTAFALSLAVDRLGDGRGFALVVEDGAKLLGILAWAAYFLATGADIVRSVVAEARRAGRAPEWRTPGPNPLPGSATGAQRAAGPRSDGSAQPIWLPQVVPNGGRPSLSKLPEIEASHSAGSASSEE